MKVFISHKHRDAELAEAVRKAFEAWGLSDDEVFLSSRFERPRLEHGKLISAQLLEQLRDTDFFLLIYTQPEQDWSYCNWEIGAAQGAETCDTTIVALSFFGAYPSVLEGILGIDATDRRQIRGFVEKFLVDPGYAVPDPKRRHRIGTVQKFWEPQGSDKLNALSDELFNDLIDASNRLNVDQTVDEQHRLKILQLALDPDNCLEVERLRQEARQYPEDTDEWFKLREAAKNHIRLNAFTIPTSNKSAVEEFGFDNPSKIRRLDLLLSQWERDAQALFKEKLGRDLPPDEKLWQSNLLEDLSRATDERKSKAQPEAMRSLESGGRNYLQPIVCRSRKFSDGRMEYDIYFFKLPYTDDEM